MGKKQLKNFTKYHKEVFYSGVGISKHAEKELNENGFEGSPGGSSGTLNYNIQFTSTPSGGNITQNPNHFVSSDKTVNHMNNQQSGSAVGNLPDLNKPTKSEPSPAAKFDQAKSDKPLNPDLSYDKDINQIFQKKDTPSPDEIMSALQYELGRMVKKDKTIAKRMVISNLKENPHHYSQLDMLNIDDKKMKVDETTISKTKAVLDEMIVNKQKRQMPPPPNLREILSDMKMKRFGSK